MKFSYSFEDCGSYSGTDRQTESISECSYSQRPFKWYTYDTRTYQSWKLDGNEENNIPNQLH